MDFFLLDKRGAVFLGVKFQCCRNFPSRLALEQYEDQASDLFDLCAGSTVADSRIATLMIPQDIV